MGQIYCGDNWADALDQNKRLKLHDKTCWLRTGFLLGFLIRCLMWLYDWYAPGSELKSRLPGDGSVKTLTNPCLLYSEAQCPMPIYINLAIAETQQRSSTPPKIPLLWFR